MFWDNVAKFYDFFINLTNRKVNLELVLQMEKLFSGGDTVLECGCGTGMLTKAIAKNVSNITATDYSENMLKETKKKCKNIKNLKIEKADINNLNYQDETFDKVVAGNIIHLLENPYKALLELDRVCKNNGNIIIPTYIISRKKGTKSIITSFLDKIGISFKSKFTEESYKEFFAKANYKNVKYISINGNIPCIIAIIQK